MRIQLARPRRRPVGPDLYNQVFTMHGTVMMFLFAVPVMEALGVYLVPLMLGARNIAFPRLNAFSYWVYLFGGHHPVRGVRSSTSAPDAGWFAYPPLAGPDYSPRQARRLLGAADHLHRDRRRWPSRSRSS